MHIREAHGFVLIFLIIHLLSQGCPVHFESLARLTAETSVSPACIQSLCYFSYTLLNTQPAYAKAALYTFVQVSVTAWLQ